MLDLDPNYFVHLEDLQSKTLLVAYQNNIINRPAVQSVNDFKTIFSYVHCIVSQLLKDAHGDLLVHY